jgi:VWFA-related protein
MPIISRFTAVLFAIACTCASARAQKPSAAQPGSHQITLDVTVDNKAMEPVPGLTAADFRVLDNKAVQPITSFKELPGTENPTEVLFVMDAVNLPYSRVAFARQQIDQFFSSNGGKLAQPTSLAIVMDTNSQILPGFTKDGNQLRTTLDHYTVGLRDINRAGGFYGADERFNLSLNALQSIVQKAATLPGRKRIIWVSAGWPLLSGPEVDLSTTQRRNIFAKIVGLSTEMREGHITLDAVNPIGAEADVSLMTYYETFLKGVRNTNDAQIGDLGLQVIAVQSGGLVLNASNDVTALLARSFDQTRDAYRISFAAAPGEHPNEYHQIQVQVMRPGLTAHTSTGYYAQPTVSEPGTTPVNATPLR